MTLSFVYGMIVGLFLGANLALFFAGLFGAGNSVVNKAGDFSGDIQEPSLQTAKNTPPPQR